MIRLLILSLSIISCSSTHMVQSNHHMHTKSIERLIQDFDDPSRDSWQKPSEVIGLMGDITNKKIIDIGSGSGYFTFKLAEQGAFVVAADVDQRFLNHIQSQLKPSHKIELRKIPFDIPMMKKKEFDHALLVNTYHHIDNRVEYFKKVLYGLKSNGMLIIVDYKVDMGRASPKGPPQHLKIKISQVIEELSLSGFKKFKIDDSLLPYQYVITCFK